MDTAFGVVQIPTHSYNPPTGIYVTGDWATLNPSGIQLQDEGRDALGANAGIGPMALGRAAHPAWKQKMGKSGMEC